MVIKTKSSKRYYNIDFLRTLLALLIIVYHSYGFCIGRNKYPGLVHLNVCVDLFFIMSGFFLFSTISVVQDTFEFIKKKFFRFAPVMWLTVPFVAIAAIFAKGIRSNFFEQIFRCLMFTNIGLNKFINPNMLFNVSWYVCVCFWVSIFYFYLNKILEKRQLNMAIWLIVFIGFGIYFGNGRITGGHDYFICNFIDIGVLRGLIGMGIGYFIYMFYNSEFLSRVSGLGRLIVSFIEIYILYFFARYFIFSNHVPMNSMLCYCFMFSVLFFLFLKNVGIVSKIINNKWAGILGKYTYSMYMMHWFVILFFKYIIYDKNVYYHNHPEVMILFIILVTIFISIPIYHLYEKPIYLWAKRRIVNMDSEEK